MNKKESGMADKTAIFIGIVLILLIMGFFRSGTNLYDRYHIKSLLNIPCGLTLNNLSDNNKINFPLTVDGYINGCGWDANGKVAGTIQIFDDAGDVVSASTQILVNEVGVNLPLSIESTIYLKNSPRTDTGKVLIRANSGLTKIIPVSF